ASDFGLDYGKHELRVHQTFNGLDSPGGNVTVLVPPPAPSIADVVTSGADPSSVPQTITSPDGAAGQAKLTVEGTGLPPDRRPGTAVVSQGATKLGSGLLDRQTGRYSIPVTLSGVGPTQISVSQTASSLSGAGAAESDKTTIGLVIRPPAIVIDTPTSGMSFQ